MRLSSTVLLLLASTAHAERRAVIGVAPCSPEVAPLVAAVREVAARQLDRDVLDAATVAALLLPPDAGAAPDLDVDAALRQAQESLHRGEFDAASQWLDTAIGALELRPPSESRWEALRTARTMGAWVAVKAAHPETAQREALGLLQVEPTYVPDGGAFPPVVENLFRDTLLAMRLQPTGELRVTSQPSGLPVDVDGRELGRTPLRISLPRAEYRVELDLGGGRSLRRSVTLQQRAEVVFDAEVPLALRLDSGPCLDVDLDGAPVLAAAVSTALGLASLVTLSKAPGGPLRVALLDGATGAVVRESWVDVPVGGLSTSDDDAIAAFLNTGVIAPPLRSAAEAGAALAPTAVPRVATRQEQAAPMRRDRVAGYFAGGAALVAAGVAVAFAVDGQQAQRALAGQVTPDGRAYVSGSQGAVSRLNARATNDGHLALATAIGAGVLAGASAVVLWLSKSDG